MVSSVSRIRLIIGLGNPDQKYKNTYHNVGFLTIDYLAENPPAAKLFKSDVYMNQSGSFVKKALKKAGAKPEELLVAHDDSDLEIGKYKLSFGRGAAGHHGIENIQATLKTKDFWRLRIGIRPQNADFAKNTPTSRTSDKFRVSPRSIRVSPRRMKAGEFVLKKISAAHQKLLSEVFECSFKDIAKQR